MKITLGNSSGDGSGGRKTPIGAPDSALYSVPQSMLSWDFGNHAGRGLP
jgi:hypothetical protein